MGYTIAYIAEYLEADIVSASSISGFPEIEIQALASPLEAVSDEITFVSSAKYLSELSETGAAAAILGKEFVGSCPVPALVVDDAYLAYAKISELFSEPRPQSIIHASAVIAESALIGEGCYIGANAVLGENVSLGDDVVISAGVSLGARAKIGTGSLIHPNVAIYHDVEMGSNCIIHSGAAIGSDGFGFAPSSEGYVKIHQLGTVVIGDRVEIGANTSIDRGALGNTEIHDGVKIDNLVHIAHNCIIGENTAVAGQVGMAGTTRIGKNCTFGGQVGIAGHIEIADNVQVSGKSMVTKSITKPGRYSSGTGFSDSQSWRRNVVRFNQLDEIYKRLVGLEKKLNNKN